MSASLINEKVTSAVSAIEAGDWSTALSKLTAAKALLSAIPDAKQDVNLELRWDRKAIDSLISDCNRRLSASSGVGATGGMFQFQAVTYAGECE